MYQKILQDPSFWAFLQQCDEDLASATRASGCPRCGGRLHSARYPRKPRGCPRTLDAAYGIRLSLCCSVEGCRRRSTPASVRFLDRRVYLGAVVIVASVLRHGATPVRASRLRELFGVDRRTLERWRLWWQTMFSESPFWRSVRGRFATAVQRSALPVSLLERFGGDAHQRLVGLLQFLSPLGSSTFRLRCVF